MSSHILRPLTLGPLPPDPLVTVLIANYNYGHMLPAALDSVLNQTYQKFEIVVCDDGSTDESLSVLQAYAAKDSRVRYVVQQNSGMSVALNRAFNVSHGTIISLLDADDYYEPNKIELVKRLFEDDVGVGLGLNRMRMVDSRDRTIGALPLLGAISSGWFGETIVTECWGTAACSSYGSAVSFRREIGDMVFPLDPTFHRNADSVIVMRSLLVTRVAGIDDCLTSYRIHTANSSYSPRVTSARIEADLRTEERLWADQRNFAGSLNPQCRAGFPLIEARWWVLALKYLKARMDGQPNARELRSELIRNNQFKELRLLSRLVWRSLFLVPKALIPDAVAPLFGAGAIRKAISHAMAYTRGRRRATVKN